jgi:hypothetical protein
MEVVVLRIAKSDEGANHVDESYAVLSALHSANFCADTAVCVKGTYA